MRGGKHAADVRHEATGVDHAGVTDEHDSFAVVQAEWSSAIGGELQRLRHPNGLIYG
jgi:hypothetical protein